MVVTSNVSPTKNLYFLGGKILEVILSNPREEYDIILLFNSLKDKISISFVIFTYTLDWLFLIGVIKVNNDGSISKCF